MGINGIAAYWGLAEATLFFIVPDVWCSVVGRTNLRAGFVACVWSLLGALAGGLIMFQWGAQDFAQVSLMVESIPAISVAMIEHVRSELVEQGLWAVLLGPISGTPYKLYAIQSAQAGIGVWDFLLISIPARFLRFTLVTLFCHVVLQLLKRGFPDYSPLAILLSGWTIFYLFYFWHMSG